MVNRIQLLDPRTGKRYPLLEPRWRSDDGGPLLVEAGGRYRQGRYRYQNAIAVASSSVVAARPVSGSGLEASAFVTKLFGG